MSDPASEAASVHAVVAGVGARLRRLRRERGLTLAQVADATDTALSTLSRVEAAGRRPSLDILLRLARVYRVTLDDLVGAPATGDPRVHPKPRVRHGLTWLALTERPGGIQAYKVIMPAGFRAGEREQRSHEGYEWTYVLDGRLRLLLDDHDIVLSAGEVAEFDTHTPHAFSNPGDTPTEFLVLMGPQGQRAHVRARPSRAEGGPSKV
jgi:transcriptional regulator with XRE-family HTH domain